MTLEIFFNLNDSVILERDTNNLAGVSYTEWAPVVVKGHWAVQQVSLYICFIPVEFKLPRIHTEALAWQPHDPCWINLAFPLLLSACPCEMCNVFW